MDDKRLSRHEFTDTELLTAAVTVMKQAIRSTGGSQVWQGETKEFLTNMENLVALVEGRSYQPKPRDALDELAIVDDVLDRANGLLNVEFSAAVVDLKLKPEDNPMEQVSWMKDCNHDLKSSIRGLRQTLEGERPIRDENWEHRQTGRDFGL